MMTHNAEMEQKIIDLRRTLHRHAETGWTEFWTTARVAGTLTELGYEVSVGRDVVKPEAVMGRPSEEMMAEYVRRALDQGADPAWIEKMDGFTGAMGVLDTGRKVPVVAFRYDMDAVDVSEAGDSRHRPRNEGFASLNDGAMHSCGHDGHTAMGLGLAEILMENKDKLTGVIKLLFQPAEEGVRGGKAMAEKGLLDDVDYFVGAHIGNGLPSGTVAPGIGGFLCTTKFDLVYTGKASHAGAAPQEGRNALLAAASAALAMAGIAPHSDGPTRLNVGVLEAGTGRNVIPSRAIMKVETRGSTSKLNSYVYSRAMEVAAGAAAMYGAEFSVAKMGEAVDASSDSELVDLVGEKAVHIPGIVKVGPLMNLGGSEDVSWMMKAVQKRGGKAVYFGLGSDIAAGHHNEYFDIDEEMLLPGTLLFAELAFALAGSK